MGMVVVKSSYGRSVWVVIVGVNDAPNTVVAFDIGM